MKPTVKNLNRLASSIKLGLCPVPKDLTRAEKVVLRKLGVVVDPGPKPDLRPWKLK